MDQEQFRQRLSQVAEIDPAKSPADPVIHQVLVPMRPCEWCPNRMTNGRNSIYLAQDSRTRQREWRIYCNTCSRHLDAQTGQPIIRTQPVPAEPKRPRGRPRKDSRP